MKQVSLGDISEICTGKLDVNASSENGEYPFFTCSKTVYRIDNYAFDNEVVLVAGNGDLNVKYYSGKFNAYQRTYVIQNKNKAKLSMKYLYYFMEIYINKLRNDSVGGVIKYIKLGNLTGAKIPLPNIGDQKCIAHLLGKVEGLITQRKQQLQQLDDLLKSVFLEMFGDPVKNEKGWETLTWESYSDLLTVGVVIKPASYYQESGVIALRSLNIKPNKIDLNNLVFFSKNSSEGPLAKSMLKTDDVVIVRTGKTGTAAVIPSELDGANCIDLIIVRPKKNIINPLYLTSLLNSERGKALVSSKEVGGIQKHFNIGAMKKIAFPIPPISNQNNFALIVKKTENIKLLYQKSLNDLEQLYGALSQKAFKGELDLSRIKLDELEDKTNEESKKKEFASEAQETKLSMETSELVKNVSDRKAFLTAKLKAFIQQASNEITVESFFNDLNLSEFEFDGEQAVESIQDYELVKQWLFDAIDSGAVEQKNDEVVLDESVQAGNEVVLMKA